MKIFKKLRAKHIKLGFKGEKLSYKLLKSKQYQILCRGYRPKNRSGEIDIIARDGRTLCFIEVKTRYKPNQNYYTNKIWVSKNQISRIKKAARSYLNEISMEKINYRFDLIEVSINKYGLKSIYHWQRDFGIFLPGS
ncbi:MAG TPA: YraN family protein [Victivallales bacterium]|nr:YraN family protein [Victivallales bacterium]